MKSTKFYRENRNKNEYNVEAMSKKSENKINLNAT